MGITVLSLFDGISGAQVALERAGIEVDTYYASEIDKYAINITQANYPNTVQLESVENIKAESLPKIDLLIGGSPCQGFSSAGKGFNFNDDRSKLFFEYVRLLIELTPKYFILENVKMKQEWQDIISSYLGVSPVLIDSALVSAQSRKRLYWTNIPVQQPKDKNILLQDIIEDGFVDRDKSFCVLSSEWKGCPVYDYWLKNRRQRVFSDKAQTILSTIFKENAKSMVKRGKKGLLVELEKDWVRKLTPLECERLQTFPDNYTACVSNTQRYKALGNSFTVDVIAHILEGIKTMTFQSFDDITHDLIDQELTEFVNAKTEYKLRKGKLVDYCIKQDMETNRRQKEWDGQIHPSALNWNSSPETQYKKLYNKGTNQPGAQQLKAFMVGDFVHEKVERIVGKHLFTGWAEVPLVNKEIKFQGTADFVGFAPGIGWCLIDFKTYSELQTDRQGGDRLAKKYALDLDADPELKARLYTKRRVIEGPDNTHACQAFTYALFFNEFNNYLPCPPIEYVVICYLGKDQMETQEFYLSLKDNQHLLAKAYQNYKAVLELVEKGNQDENS